MTEYPIDRTTGEMYFFEPAYHDRDVKWLGISQERRRLRIVEWTRHGHQAKFVLADDKDIRYPLFPSEIPGILEAGVDVGGWIDGIWTQTKRGQSYSLKFLQRGSCVETAV